MCAILAHRGNVDGKVAAAENRPPAIAAALSRGWGLEIDIRRSADGRFYVSHDPSEHVDDLLADDVFALIAGAPTATVALNVKETGDEHSLLAFLERWNVIDRVFLFDMELVEPSPGGMARRFRELHPHVQLAARVSDRNESVERALSIDGAAHIWLDEFDGPWCTEGVVGRLRAAGRTVYAVSPELHGFPLEAARQRWRDFVAWGVDGICTDYAAELDSVLGMTPLEIA